MGGVLVGAGVICTLAWSPKFHCQLMMVPLPLAVLSSWKLTGPLEQVLLLVNRAMGAGVMVTCSWLLSVQPSLLVTVKVMS